MINLFAKNKSVFFLLMFSLLTILGLGGGGETISYILFAKYLSLVCFAIVFLLEYRHLGGDALAKLGLYLFLALTIFFTLINDPDGKSLFVIFGYMVCIIIYMVSASIKITSDAFYEKFMVIFSVSFAIANFSQIFNPDAYSLIKSQFTGFLGNANAFSGICGLCLIYLASKLLGASGLKKRLYFLSLIILYATYVVLAGSRTAILALVFAMFFLGIKSITRVYMLVGIACLVCVYFYFGGLIGLNIGGFSSRDLFEETGRGGIFDNYVKEISEWGFIGTGLGEHSGRIKSEISYLDLILFSGVGVLGFFIFLLRTYYFSFVMLYKYRSGGWFIPIFAYITFSSIFEGYAANVVSLPSIFLYISAGLIYSSYKHRKLNSKKSPYNAINV